MFGIGGKEKDLVATITPVIEDVLQEKAPQIIQLPDYLQARYKDFGLLTEEYDVLRSTRRKNRMPKAQKAVYDRRIFMLESQLKGLQRIAMAVHLGYEPFTISQNYYIGGVEDPVGNWTFNAPLPPGILTKYDQAKKTRLFDQLVVASPDPNHFRKISTIRIDPILLGYVRDDERSTVNFHFRSGQTKGNFSNWVQTEGYPGVKVDGGIGFKIAHWDLSQDLKALNP